VKLFLTGGTGFIGSHFINQATAAGHEIIGLRRTPESTSRIGLHQEPAWIDKTLEEVVPADMAGCETVVHLAAHSANVPYDRIEACIHHNVTAPLVLFRAALEAGINRFIVAGSCFEYGLAGERYDLIPPDAPLEPTASYPASKAAASIAFQAFAREERASLLILRIFQVFGEGEAETRFWPTLRRAALAGENLPMSEGKQIRDFIRVEDVAKAFVSALERQDLEPGQPLVENLGSGAPRTLASFAHAEWKRLGATGRLLPGAIPMRKTEVMRFAPLIR
jgi:nucleoside-diphosphate-sugar epimerase